MARPTVPGRSVAFAQTAAINRTSSALPPFGESANVNCRDVIANQIFHRMWKNLFAVAGTRERLPAGVIDKRGLRPPLARPRRAGATFPPPAGGDPRWKRALPSALSGEYPKNRTVEFISYLKSGNTCLDLLCRAW